MILPIEINTKTWLLRTLCSDAIIYTPRCEGLSACLHSHLYSFMPTLLCWCPAYCTTRLYLVKCQFFVTWCCTLCVWMFASLQPNVASFNFFFFWFALGTGIKTQLCLFLQCRSVYIWIKVLYHTISYPLSQTLGKNIHHIFKKNIYDKFKSSRGLISLLRVPATGKCETQEDVWSVWDGIHGITRRPENIKVYPTCNLLVVVAMSEHNNLTSNKGRRDSSEERWKFTSISN